MTTVRHGKKLTGGWTSIPSLSLTHAQTLWTLKELGLTHGASNSTFAYYVKSLRKLSIPFEYASGDPEHRKWVHYHYEQLMELAIALSFRVYVTLPDIIPTTLRKHRRRLYRFYRNAISKAETPHASPANSKVAFDTQVPDIFLELGLGFKDGRLIEEGEPHTLNAEKAFEHFAFGDPAFRSWLPINLSRLAQRVVDVAMQAPPPRTAWPLQPLQRPLQKDGPRGRE